MRRTLDTVKARNALGLTKIHSMRKRQIQMQMPDGTVAAIDEEVVWFV